MSYDVARKDRVNKYAQLSMGEVTTRRLDLNRELITEITINFGKAEGSQKIQKGGKYIYIYKYINILIIEDTWLQKIRILYKYSI